MPKDTRAEYLKFAEDLEIAKMTGPEEGDDLPIIEAPRHLIEAHNRGKMAAFDKCGYWIYKDIRVVEVGKREEIREKVRLGFVQ